MYSTELCTEDWICLLLSLCLHTLSLLCSSTQSCLVLKCALLFEASEVFVVHFMIMSKGQFSTESLLLHKAQGKVAPSPGKLREAGRKTMLLFSLL